jgi:hypothetical protein
MARITGTVGGARNVTLTSFAGDAAVVNAKTGAAGGDVTLVPSVAIALSNVTTTASLDDGPAFGLTGFFGAQTDQSASARTYAEGDAEGDDAAVGVSLALTIANHRSEATIARDLTAIAAISLSALGATDTSASATASAAGAPADSSGSSGGPGDGSISGSAGSGVDDTVAQERSFADATSSSNGGSGAGGVSPTPSDDASPLPSTGDCAACAFAEESALDAAAIVMSPVPALTVPVLVIAAVVWRLTMFRASAPATLTLPPPAPEIAVAPKSLCASPADVTSALTVAGPFAVPATVAELVTFA